MADDGGGGPHSAAFGILAGVCGAVVASLLPAVLRGSLLVWVFAFFSLVGLAALYMVFATLDRNRWWPTGHLPRHVKAQRQHRPDVTTPSGAASPVGSLRRQATSMVTDRWRLTTDGHQVPILMRLRDNSMSHPGYTSRSFTENPPPAMRVGVVVPCEPLGSVPATSDIRARFLTFLQGQRVSSVLAALTTTNPDDRWTARDGRGRFNFGAVLDTGTETAPMAWARLLLPQSDMLPFGYGPPSAVFILHVFPRTRGGSPAQAANLARWHARFVQGLGIPGALAEFLTHDLRLAITGDQPAQAGIYLDAAHSMAELVDIKDLTVLPGSPASNWFMGWAISSPDGAQAPDLARDWLTQMCDNTLHVDGYEPILAATVGAGHPAQGFPEGTSALTPSQARRPRSKAALSTGIGVVACASIIAAILLTQPSTPAGKAPSHQHHPQAGGTGPSAQQLGVLTDGPAGYHRVDAVAFNSRGATLITGDSDGNAYVWNVAAQRRTTTLPGSRTRSVSSVAFSPNGAATLATGDSNGTIYFWHLSKHRPTGTLTDPFRAAINSIAFSPNGTELAAGDTNGVTYLWNLASRHETALPDSNTQGVSSVAFSPNGTELATGDSNGTTYLWSVATRRIVARLPDPSTQGINAVAFSRNGATLATGDYNGTTYLWSVATRRIVAHLADPSTQPINAVAFSPNGATLATGNSNGTAYLWNLATRRASAPLSDPYTLGVSSVAFSPDGATLAVGDSVGKTYLWHITG